MAIVSPLFNAMYGGFSVDAARWPRYAAFAERVENHEPVRRVREIEKQALQGMVGG